MTRDKSPRAIAVRAVAQKSLEVYAAKILDPDAVLGAVTKAAAEGFFCLRVAPDAACDLRGTKAAAAIGELLKREGFEHQWDGRMSMRKENPSGCDVMVFDLCVFSWNRDPAAGLIFIQSGPRQRWSTLTSGILGGRDWNADCGDDRQDTSCVFFTGQVDQGDLPGFARVAQGRAEGHSLERDRVPV